MSVAGLSARGEQGWPRALVGCHASGAAPRSRRPVDSRGGTLSRKQVSMMYVSFLLSPFASRRALGLVGSTVNHVA